MYIPHGATTVKQDHIDDFIKSSIADGTGSILHDPGATGSTLSQDETNPKLFAFTEV